LFASLCPGLQTRISLSDVENYPDLCAARSPMETPRFFQVSFKCEAAEGPQYASVADLSLIAKDQGQFLEVGDSEVIDPAGGVLEFAGSAEDVG
jgi:hypothetical protein